MATRYLEKNEIILPEWNPKWHPEGPTIWNPAGEPIISYCGDPECRLCARPPQVYKLNPPAAAGNPGGWVSCRFKFETYPIKGNFKFRVIDTNPEELQLQREIAEIEALEKQYT